MMRTSEKTKRNFKKTSYWPTTLTSEDLAKYDDLGSVSEWIDFLLIYDKAKIFKMLVDR